MPLRSVAASRVPLWTTGWPYTWPPSGSAVSNMTPKVPPDTRSGVRPGWFGYQPVLAWSPE